MPRLGWCKEQGQRPMRSLFVLDDERAILKRVAKLVKHGTDEQREQVVAFASDGEESEMRAGKNELRRAYTIRAYDKEWVIIKAFMDKAKQRGMHLPAKSFLSRLEDAVLDRGINGVTPGRV